MKIAKYVVGASLLILNMASFAASADQTALRAERLKVIHEYLNDLRTTNAPKIEALFAPNGVVISTSKGRVAPKQFFNAFFSELSSAAVTTFSIYKEVKKPDAYAARFYFSWIEKSGETGGGNYMDDFIFAQNSQKLLQVFMFENKS